eukprot:GHVS01019872.1.p1 GENE.GHVS01019872.1~~GHVS01019872.1.p1  ORF type:complete len:110 (-),score=5.93 GHVS01019872.1:74-403(-)
MSAHMRSLIYASSSVTSHSGEAVERGEGRTELNFVRELFGINSGRNLSMFAICNDFCSLQPNHCPLLIMDCIEVCYCCKVVMHTKRRVHDASVHVVRHSCGQRSIARRL